MFRCANERCERKLKCKRYLNCLPWETYSYSYFNEADCEYFIEKEIINDKNKQKQALIDTMRGDEEIGLYDDNEKNHGYER
jgi:hypothetical protein